ncbi:hypothetical protein JCM5350_003686 [Sporobolomyces pararoseus]
MTTTIPASIVSNLRPPLHSQLVHREECTQCFDTVYLLSRPEEGFRGLDVCLTCFNGSCPSGSLYSHSDQHCRKTGHQLYLNILKKPKPTIEKSKRDSQEPPIKKLAIRPEISEQEQFETFTKIKLFDSSTSTWNDILQDDQVPEEVRKVVEGVLNSMDSGQKNEIKSWEEEILPCQHTKELIQQPQPQQEGQGGHCSKCELTSNLWMCLICGSLGCGRKQFGAENGGGNGHGLQHTHETGHSVAVKLGTIEPDGTADVYCYSCDDARIDPELSKHLNSFGIKVSNLKKTEKSMTELQVEQNMNFDFSMTSTDGKLFEPVFGPGLTGLKNLGNSCYLASTLQSLFSLPQFQQRYQTSFLTHSEVCLNPSPSECFECQMGKIAQGLLSGRYSKPTTTTSHSGQDEQQGEGQVPFQEGLKPSMFKNLVGKNHSEFSTMKQQDASEFLFHLLEFIKRSSKKEGTSEGVEQVTDELYGYELEERLECKECNRVRYKLQPQEGLSLPVPVVKRNKTSSSMEIEGEGKGDDKEEFEPVQLEECLKNFVEPQIVENYSCSNCQKKTLALKSSRFSTFPKVLILNTSRFQLENWVPRKVDVPLLFDPKLLELSNFIGKGLQPGEKELPQEEEEEKPLEHSFDQSVIDQLTSMGFPEIRAKRALLKTGNQGDAEAAMNWLFEHMDDQDLDDPLPPPTTSAASGGGGGGNEPGQEQISMLVDMGFTPAQGRKALLETGGDPNRAVEWLFSHPDDDGTIVATSTSTLNDQEKKVTSRGSKQLPVKYRLKTFISHKGPSVHSGHYVSHVWTGQASSSSSTTTTDGETNDREGEGEGSWVLFNDEKVVRAGKGEKSGDSSAGEWMEKAYVYLWERIDQE